MRPAETIATLASHERRGAGTDAERRAAAGLAQALDRPAATTRLETFWCRPNWALAHAWHALLGVAGSLLAESQPRAGAALLALALLSLLADAATGVSLGRRLTPERASQNVVSEPDEPSGSSDGPSDEPDELSDRRSEHSEPDASDRSGRPEGPGERVHLIVTANYDAGRTGLVFRDRPRRTAAAAARLTGRIGPGWQGWMAIALAWLLVLAILRLNGHRGTAIGVAQLVPTVGLVIALALLVDLATAEFGPSANDNATGVAAAIALVQALDAAPPRSLSVELVLQGAGDGGAIGLRRHLRRRRASRRAPNTVVLGIAACGGGTPRWWKSDGPLLPASYFGQLRRMCAQVAHGGSFRPHRGRGTTPALPARLRRLPAIALGCLEEPGVAPRSHQLGDTPERVDLAAVDRLVEHGLLLVDAVDAFVAHRRGPRPRAAAWTE